MTQTKKYNPVKTIRIPEELLEKIKTSEGGDNFTQWMKQAIHAKLETENGLTTDYKKRLVLLIQNLISLGRDLNKLARSADEGKHTTLNDELLKSILKEIQSTKSEVVNVSTKL